MKLVLEIDLEEFAAVETAKKVLNDLIDGLSMAADGTDLRAPLRKFEDEPFVTVTELVDPFTEMCGARMVIMRSDFDPASRSFEETERMKLDQPEKIKRRYTTMT